MTMLTMYLGTQHTQSCSALQVRETGAWYFGMRDVRQCHSSFFYIANLYPLGYARRTESRYTQQVSLKVSPVQTSYAPDGKSLLYVSAGHQFFFVTHGKPTPDAKEEWRLADKDPVSFTIFSCRSIGYSSYL